MKKIFLCAVLFAALSVSVFADFESVEVITAKTDGKTQTAKKRLERQPDGAFRFVIPAAELASGIASIDIVGDFAKAKKGEAGYFVLPPNSIGSFTQDDGKVEQREMGLPIFGMKNPRSTFVAIVKGLRFEFSTIVKAENGEYTMFPRFHIADIGFAPYEDLIVDFYELKGGDADYCGMARTYRKYQLDRGEVRPIKERVKTSPSLKFTVESIFVRFANGSKERDTRFWLQTEENQPKFSTYITFANCTKKMRQFHAMGMRKVEVCFVGWNIEGFEGRLPDLFPPDPHYGGEAGMKEAIEVGRGLGFQMTNHVCNTIFTRRAKRFSEYAVAKRADGTLLPYGIKKIPCGEAFMPCIKVVCEQYADDDYRGMQKLGFKTGTHHIDVTSAIMPHPCFDPAHPCTRKDTAEYQNKIGEKCQKYFGGFSSESGYDHVARTLDFAMYTTPFFHHKVMWKKWKKKPNFMLDNRTIPLWQLVYHGIILSNSDWDTIDFYYPLKDESDPRLKTADTPDFNLWRRLQFWEYGGRPVFYWHNAHYVDEIKKIYDQYQKLSFLQYEFMEHHSEIAKGVFLTRYSDGSETVANYTKKPFVYKGFEVPAEDFALVPKK